MNLVLWNYWRSSASWRVRIALALKGLAYEYRAVDLVRDEQADPAYREKHPQALVPTLEVDGVPLVQSLAILEWLEETFPTPALLPGDTFARAKVRAFALAIACEIHPLSNLAVRRHLAQVLHLDEGDQTRWHHRWLEAGLGACERMIRGEPGPFCFGGEPSLADCVLVPQLYNARRYGFPLDSFPRLGRAEAAMLALPAVRRTVPEAQPDASRI